MKFTDMLKILNIVRYLASFILPIAAVAYGGFYAGIITLIVLLIANNVADDLLFFYGSCFVSTRTYSGGVACPVEGVVTNVEYGVRKYSHLEKCDTLTKEVLVDKFGISDLTCKRYNHVTVFLNKMNKHVVTNASSGIARVVTFDNEGNRYTMVEDGMIVADNRGDYLKNTFVEIQYSDGVVVIVTMDKYISKAYPFSHDSVCSPNMFICRGSQCDIYLPEDYELIPLEVGMKTRINQSLTIQDEDVHYEDVDYSSLIFSFLRCINEASVSFILRDNIKKSMKTFIVTNKVAIYILLTSVLVLHPNVGVFVTLGSFCADRWARNLIYSVMNVCGYSPVMTDIYRTIHKILTYGK